jgi:hypothetical protein
MHARLVRGYPCLFAGLLLLVWPASGCRMASHRDGVALSLTVPLLPFLQARPGESGMKNAIVDFPTLEVFDGAGQLVYLSHDADKNIALVKLLPGALDRLTELPNQPILLQVIGSLPGLTEGDKVSLLHSRQPTVIAFSLEDCHACSAQEEALGPETLKNLTVHGLNSLMIRVSRPR